jgi:hypothetical protein
VKHFIALFALVLTSMEAAETGRVLPGNRELMRQEGVSERMGAGIEMLPGAELVASPGERAAHWRPDVSSRAACDASVNGNRGRLAKMPGVEDARVGEIEPIKP